MTYGAVYAVLSSAVEGFYCGTAALSCTKLWMAIPSLGLFPLAMLFLFISSIFQIADWKVMLLPTLLAVLMFWAAREVLVRRFGLHGVWKIRLGSAFFGALASLAAFVAAFCIDAGSSWTDLYFYQPNHTSVLADREWGFMSVYGPLFHWTCIAFTGLTLGFGLSMLPNEEVQN